METWASMPRVCQPARCTRPDAVVGRSLRVVLASTNWATVASFATAVGTLVLAFATFASIRSANRSARVAEEAFRVGLRPVLVTSRLDDPVQKIRWMDNHWARLDGAQGIVQLIDDNIYLAISLRNAGAGLAVAVGEAGAPDAGSLHSAERRRLLAGRHS